jgi:hypothetical protein
MQVERCSHLFAALTLATITLTLAVCAQAQHETVLFTFPSTSLTAGQFPFTGLISDSLGNLYGTTGYGGTSTTSQCSSFGCGVVYKLSATSTAQRRETVLYSFQGGTDGSLPFGNLVLDASGNIYGTTYRGGSSAACPASRLGSSCGTLFKLTHSAAGWKKTTQFSFKGGVNGGFPSGVIFDAAGNLYGAAEAGGDVSGCPSIDLGGCGVIFKLTPSGHGWTETVLYTFTGGADGGRPVGGVVFDASGNLYAATSFGGVGCALGCGMVVKLSPTTSGPWIESSIYTFTGDANGGYPNTGLTLDPSGNLYAATIEGGTKGFGTLIQLSPNTSGGWTENTIRSLEASHEGFSTSSPFAFDSAGNLYAENSAGGANGCGTVFELSPASGSWLENTVTTFDCHQRGGNPAGGLIIDAHDNLYGAAENDTIFGSNAGVIFKIKP